MSFGRACTLLTGFAVAATAPANIAKADKPEPAKPTVPSAPEDPVQEAINARLTGITGQGGLQYALGRSQAGPPFIIRAGEDGFVRLSTTHEPRNIQYGPDKSVKSTAQHDGLTPKERATATMAEHERLMGLFTEVLEERARTVESDAKTKALHKANLGSWRILPTPGAHFRELDRQRGYRIETPEGRDSNGDLTYTVRPGKTGGQDFIVMNNHTETPNRITITLGNTRKYDRDQLQILREIAIALTTAGFEIKLPDTSTIVKRLPTELRDEVSQRGLDDIIFGAGLLHHRTNGGVDMFENRAIQFQPDGTYSFGAPIQR